MTVQSAVNDWRQQEGEGYVYSSMVMGSHLDSTISVENPIDDDILVLEILRIA